MQIAKAPNIMQANKRFIGFVVAAAIGLPEAMFGEALTNTPPNGHVAVVTNSPNEIVGLYRKLIVPTVPSAVGTLFVWPGLQPAPGGSHYMPIDNGVLQSVLSWGPSCAPGK